MSAILRTGAMSISFAAVISAAASGQATHVVRLVANPANDVYRFEPAEVVTKPGDVLVFRVVSGAPHSVVYEAQGLSPGVRGAFNNAMP